MKLKEFFEKLNNKELKEKVIKKLQSKNAKKKEQLSDDTERSFSK